MIKMIDKIKLSNKEKISLFFSLFQGLKTVYGTYSTKSEKHWQIKKEVTGKVIEDHLMGRQPYGFYPLNGDKTTVGIADFDDLDPLPPIAFIKRAVHYGLFAYLEKSKSKGYHVWLFFPEDGVSARKLRLVTKHILDEIDSPNTEIFPKQDSINKKNSYGNFINAPLFGKLIPEVKTIFIHEDSSLQPYEDQWELLKSIERNSEQLLDSIIDINNLSEKKQGIENKVSKDTTPIGSRYGLPFCIQKILCEGVVFDQRVACFRIAVNLRLVGLPEEFAVVILNSWRLKNKPSENKRIITPDEIKEQIRWAYSKDYRGYGCHEPIIKSFCNKKCRLYNFNKSK
jgi:TOTE conflict system primase-like protein